MAPRPSSWDDAHDGHDDDGGGGGGEFDDDGDDDADADPDRTRYYTRLRLDPGCSPEDVSRAYKNLSRVFHPDKSGGVASEGAGDDVGASAEDAFVDLQRCAEVLSDRVLRLAYDAGGIEAVHLVQRSQQQQSNRGRAPSSGGDGVEDGHHLYASLDRARSRDEAVSLLQQALDEHRQRQRHHRRTRGSGSGGAPPQHVDLEAYLHAPYDASAFGWEREGAALSVVAKRHLTAHRSVNASMSHRLQHRGLGQLSGSVGVEYLATSSSDAHHAGTTTYAVDARFTGSPGNGGSRSIFSSTTPPSSATKDGGRRRRSAPGASPHLSFRTSRQLASGTTWVWGLSGQFQDRRTWNYSVTSSRLLRSPSWWGSDINNSKVGEEYGGGGGTTKIHALWRGGWQATTGRLGFLMAQFRSVESSASDPQYRLRLALNNPFPFKMSYRSGSVTGRHSQPSSSDDGSWTVAYSAGWGLQWNRFKVTRSQRLGGGTTAPSSPSCKWVCRYGLKYDGRATAMLPDAPALWTVLLHLQSREWSIRIPVSLATTTTAAATAAPPGGAAWAVSVLLSQWLAEQLEQWIPAAQTEDSPTTAAPSSSSHRSGAKEMDGPGSSLITGMMAAASGAVRHVAAKKRALELQADGLVILSVAVNGDRQESLTDVLQFWVKDGSLDVPVAHVCRQWATRLPAEPPSWWWRRWWLRLVTLRPPTPLERSTGPVRLDLRYQYRGFVYDAVFPGDGENDRLLLPVKRPDRATRLGRTHQVH